MRTVSTKDTGIHSRTLDDVTELQVKSESSFVNNSQNLTQ